MAVGLGHPEVHRQVHAAAERDVVLESDVAAPVVLGQAIDADPAVRPCIRIV
jgi:hypothetical protein